MKLPPVTGLKRPPELIYGKDERPPVVPLLGLAAQHAITALTFMVYVIAAARLGQLDAAQTQTMVTASILGLAIGTGLQAWGGKLGAGLLMVHIPSPFMMVLYGMLLAKHGVSGVILAGIISGITAWLCGFVAPRLRTLLPPIVAGIVACVGGLAIIQPALEHVSGMSASGTLNRTNLLVCALTLAVIIGMSVWGGQRSKLFALLTGLIVGTIFAAFTGGLNGLDTLAQTPVLGLPHIPGIHFAISPGVLIAVIVLTVITQVDHFGEITIVHKMNDADWRRPNMKLISGGMSAVGIATIVSAFLGALPNAISTANIALAHISRTTSRHVGLVAAAILALIAFLPQVSLALTLIPTPVVGAIELYAAAYMIVSGIELITTRAMDARGTFLVGLSIVAGLGVIFVPQLAQLAPDSMLLLASNGIVVGGVTAIVLNLVFRIGTSQQAQEDFTDDLSVAELTQAVVDFVEIHGGGWQARREVVQRAAQAALEAAEAIQSTHGRTLHGIRGRFDEFNLDIELLHEGKPLDLDGSPCGHQTAPDLLDFDDDAFDAALDQALTNVSQVMINRLADRLHSGQHGDVSFLKLHFDH